MNEKEAELIGMHVGDGTLYKTNSNSIVWELRGDIRERDYYEYVKDLIKDTLSVEVKPKYRGPNSYGIQTTNKIITSFFLNNGFKPGNKTYTVSIPEHIKNSNKKIQLSFIRGLFDTDGCVWFDKNKTQYSYYPRIEFGLASKPLIDDLFLLFNKLGFKGHRWENKRDDGIAFRICLGGFANLDKWIKKVNPANNKHINRIKIGLLNKNKVSLKRVSTNL